MCGGRSEERFIRPVSWRVEGVVAAITPLWPACHVECEDHLTLPEAFCLQVADVGASTT